jgi:hypothetical protein
VQLRPRVDENERPMMCAPGCRPLGKPARHPRRGLAFQSQLRGFTSPADGRQVHDARAAANGVHRQIHRFRDQQSAVIAQPIQREIHAGGGVIACAPDEPLEQRVDLFGRDDVRRSRLRHGLLERLGGTGST